MTERRWSWLATKTSSSSTQEQNIEFSQTQTSCYGVHRVRKVLGGDIESREGKKYGYARSLFGQGPTRQRVASYVTKQG